MTFRNAPARRTPGARTLPGTHPRSVSLPTSGRARFLPGKELAPSQMCRGRRGATTLVSMSADSDSRALGAFLKARRAQLTPQECGLPDPDSARRVAGLRREEVAQLAAISVDYYTRLEQGRVRASVPVLTTLARALSLDGDQETYLYELAGRSDARPRRRRPAQRLRPAMRRLLDQLTETPALVLGKRLDILAWNASASALYTDFDAYQPPRRNYVYVLFNDPTVRALHHDWIDAASSAVAALRMEAAQDP